MKVIDVRLSAVQKVTILKAKWNWRMFSYSVMFGLDLLDEQVDDDGPQPGTKKRVQVYERAVASALRQCHPVAGQPCFVYTFEYDVSAKTKPQLGPGGLFHEPNVAHMKTWRLVPGGERSNRRLDCVSTRPVGQSHCPARHQAAGADLHLPHHHALRRVPGASQLLSNRPPILIGRRLVGSTGETSGTRPVGAGRRPIGASARLPQLPCARRHPRLQEGTADGL